MILSVTLNPAVDLTTFVDHLSIGTVNRYQAPQLDPAGKGINVSRMAHRLGWPTIAFGFLAGEIGSIIPRALEAEAVPYHFVPVPGQTRLGVTIVDTTSRKATNLYGPGPVVDRNHQRQLADLVTFWLPAGRVLVLAGSLPPGMPDDVYAAYIRRANATGIRTILDTDGVALRLGVAAQPYCIKPNREEAERLLGRALPDLNAVVQGARELAQRGIDVVVISLGAEGAVLVQDGKAWRAIPPKVERNSTVGSGDSLVAGLAVGLARGEPIVAGLRLGTAAGASTAMTPGTAQGTAAAIQALLPRVQIEELTGRATRAAA